MKRTFSKISAILGFLFLILGILLSSVFSYALNPEFYVSEYMKLHQADIIGISQADLNQVTNNLLDYTSGKRETLDMQFEMNGEVREVFNEKEKSHMVDVKDLCVNALNFQIYAYVLAVLLVALSALLHRQDVVKNLCKNCLIACAIFFSLVLIIGVWAMVSFQSFWFVFHKVFFTNDLWILNPATDILILMVPGQFFYDLVTSAIFRFVLLFAILPALSAGTLLYLKRFRRI